MVASTLLSASHDILGKKAGSKTSKKSEPCPPPAQPPIKCPECSSSMIWKDGLRYISSEIDTIAVQRYICRDCGRRFSEDTSYLQPNRRGYNRSSGHSTRQVCVALAEGSKNLAEVESRIEKQAAGATKLDEADFKSQIVQYIWRLRKQGYPKTTIKTYQTEIKRLHSCGANLSNPDTIKRVIASHDDWGNSYKEQMVSAYDHWVKMLGLSWEKPHYRQEHKLPWIPTEEEIDQLIAGCGSKTATFLQLIKETGMRYREAWLLTWTDIDYVKEILNAKSAKRGRPRQLRISRKLIGMLNRLTKTSERVFGDISYQSMKNNFYYQRKRIAAKLQNPRLNRISFHTLRHWRASVEYQRTKDLVHVKEMLGHGSIQSTMIYTHLLDDPEVDQYVSRVTRSVKGARRLVEAGFEYVTEFEEGLKLFRKPKY